MYLNEKSLEVSTDNLYEIDAAMRQFLDVYAELAGKFHMNEVYISEHEKFYLHSEKYTLEQWLAKADPEYRCLYLSFYQHLVPYVPEENMELLYEGETLIGGAEACLNQSFMFSIAFSEKWKQESIKAELHVIDESGQLLEETEVLFNLYKKEQLSAEFVTECLKKIKKEKIYDYEELWNQRERLFPHLSFCPSVKSDLLKLEKVCLNQIVLKLTELEEYCCRDMGDKFHPELLTKTTPESDSTMQKYKKEHTFTDAENEKYEASWHMRFTGIPGRIFFVPRYGKEKMLICYIGKKLPNVTYPT